MKNKTPENIDEYIAVFPKDVQELLKSMRQIIHEAAPEAMEAIKYAIPTFTLHGNLVSFAAFKNHIGLYPVPREAEGFKKALSKYGAAKATAQFPLDRPLPLSLIKKIVKYRVKKNMEKFAAKKKK